jgi:hypothetical protein
VCAVDGLHSHDLKDGSNEPPQNGGVCRWRQIAPDIARAKRRLRLSFSFTLNATNSFRTGSAAALRLKPPDCPAYIPCPFPGQKLGRLMRDSFSNGMSVGAFSAP